MSRPSRDGDRVFVQVRVTPPVSYVNDTKIAHGTQPAFVEEFDVYPRPAAPGSEAGALSLLPGPLCRHTILPDLTRLCVVG